MARRGVDVRREEILAATVELIDANGLAQTRVKDVASVLGISAGLIFYHFETKDALLAAAFRHAVRQDLLRLEQTVTRYADPVERLRRILAVYGPQGRAPGWRLWIDAWALAQREPAIRKVLRHLDDEWRAALLRTIEDGVGAEQFRCADPSAAVARIGALLDGLSVATLVYRTVSRLDLRTWVREATAREVAIDPVLLA
jgi:AcrR family transcriptional regulator